MPFLSAAIGLLGVAGSIGGSILGYEGQQRAANAEEDIAKKNQLQANLASARNSREIARKAIVARATALSNATNQGAGYGASSGLAGGEAGIANQANSAQLGNNQNTSILNSIFGLQQQVYQGQSQASLGGAISSFGSMLTSNASTFNKVGSYLNSNINSGWGGNNPNYFSMYGGQ